MRQMKHDPMQTTLRYAAMAGALFALASASRSLAADTRPRLSADPLAFGHAESAAANDAWFGERKGGPRTEH